MLWGRIKSYLPTKRTLKTIAANILELSGSAIQVVSEILVFVGGMTFFITPPLQKMYAQLLGKTIGYTVTGNGQLCIEADPRNVTTGQLTTYCGQFSNKQLLVSEIPFDFPYPDGLFTSSILLLGLGIGGVAVARLFITYAASLHEADDRYEFTKEEIAQAARMANPLLYGSRVLYILSGVGSVYATTTISLTTTAANIQAILSNFSIISPQNFNYTNPFPLVKALRLAMQFLTEIDFSILRKAAVAGSQSLQDNEYRFAIGVAVVSLFVSYTALKAWQKGDYYQTLLLRNKIYKLVKNELEKARESSVIVTVLSDGEREVEMESPLPAIQDSPKSDNEPSLVITMVSGNERVIEIVPVRESPRDRFFSLAPSSTASPFTPSASLARA